MIAVAVVGAKGRMGSTVVDAVNDAEDTRLSHTIDHGQDIAQITPGNTDVAVEFTVPSASLDNVLALVDQGVNVVVGTTGWDEDRLAKVSEVLERPEHRNQCVFVAPNFAISAVLADHFAAQAARYFESAEIIEMHHPDKIDAPSGTALNTAHAIAKARRDAGLGAMPDGTRSDAGSRGQVVEGVHVHAVRLRGLNAHEEILFGNPGEQLVIRSDCFDRGSFMQGVLLAVRQVASGRYTGLHTGLETFLQL